MAIHDNESNTQQTQNETQPSPQPAPQAKQNNGSQQSTRSTDLNNRLSRPMSRHSAGEDVNRYATRIREIFSEELRGGAGNYRVLVLHGAEQMLPVSSVILVQTHGDHASVYTLMIESSLNGKLSNRMQNFGGRQVEVLTTTGDVYDDVYWNRVRGLVINNLGQNISIIDEAGSYVVPSELSIDDNSRIRDILFNATTALYSVLDDKTGGHEERFNASWVNRNLALTAQLDYSEHSGEDISGLPVRSDISITLSGSLNDSGNTQYEQSMPLTKIDGYIDLVYDANVAQQAQQPTQWGAPAQVSTRRYIPRLVLTDSDSCLNAVTMELQLLGLSTTTMLAQNRAWAHTFLPNYSKKGKEVDLRDIGAIGYEVNLTGDPNTAPTAIDTKSSEFGREQLYQLLGLTIEDGLIFSMDVEDTGILNWIHSTFLAAARGDIDAHKYIIQSANALTLGEFGKYFNEGDPIAYDDNNRIVLGYYTDQHTGERHDLRNLDYLAMLNLLGAKDMKTVVNYANTFDHIDVPIEIRLEDRVRIIENILGSAVIKGYASQITFNPAFIEALHASLTSAGLVVRPGNISQEFGQMGVRGSTSAASHAVRNLQGGMFQQTTGPRYGKAAFGTNRSNRWSR